MRLIHFFKTEGGFTIQEILVVLLVSSLLVGFCYSLFSLTKKFLFKWQTKADVHLLVDRVLNTIALDIQKATELSEFTDSTLVIERENGGLIRYRFDGVRITRSGDVIATEEGLSILVSILPDTSTPRGPDDPPNLSVKVEGKSKASDYYAETRVRVRKSGTEAFRRTLGGTHGTQN